MASSSTPLRKSTRIATQSTPLHNYRILNAHTPSPSRGPASGDGCRPPNTGTVANLVGSSEAIGGSPYSFHSHASAAPIPSILHTVQPKSRDPYTLLNEFTINNGQITPITVWKFIVYMYSGLSLLFRKYIERATEEAQIAGNLIRIFPRCSIHSLF
jgi:hypothetical protein